MDTSDRTPAGRAGRLWLTHRIEVAERAADQLERKIHILSLEISRQRGLADAARLAWSKASDDAERWGRRVALIAGQQALRNGTATPVAVAFTWANTVGVQHPAAATVEQPTAPEGVVPTAAIVAARRAFADAVRAGVDLAVADASWRALDEARTHARRRARLLRRRWLPLMRSHLHSLDLSLEQAEQEDHARLRRLVF